MSKRNTVPELHIDPEFESYVPPLSKEEFDQLEDNILRMGMVIDPIIVWNGNMIVDGHNRYRIIQKHPSIPFRTTALVGAETREDVLEWICRMQLGRRNLTPEQRKFLIGKQYENQKHTHGGDRKSKDARSSGQNDHLKSGETIRQRIAREQGTSDSYVKGAAQYAKGLDLMEEIVPGIRNEILNGRRKIPGKEIVLIAKAKESDRTDFVKKILNGESVAETIKKQRAEQLQEKKETIQLIKESSKEMERPKEPLRSAEDVIYEMNSALDDLIFRWKFAFEQPHTDFADTDTLAFKEMVTIGMDFIHQMEEKWEEANVVCK